MRIKPVLYAFIPLAALLEHFEGIPDPVVFFAAALAIIPIAALIVHATEQVARHIGDAWGGLLNATFGNAPELIISVIALKAGLHEMVRASLIGAILANLLLAQGLAYFLGGLRHHEQTYQPTASRLYSSMMLIAVISLAVPSAVSRFFAETGAAAQELTVNLLLAIILLTGYALFLVFMLKTHPEYVQSLDMDLASEEAEPEWPLPRALATLLLAAGLAAWMSEILVGAAEGTGHALGMSQTFIGIVFLAVIGGAAEGGSAVAMALRNKVDLSIAIALGSCIQIALFVAPMLVLFSPGLGPESFRLAFNRPELVVMLLAVLIGALVSGDGHSNWFKGVQLILVYLMIALLFYFMPDAVPIGGSLPG